MRGNGPEARRKAGTGFLIEGLPALKNIYAYVDGFNCYHAINDLGRPHLKWLDYRRLIGQFVDTRVERLGPVKLFTAMTYRGPDAMARQNLYNTALQWRGVSVILGEFMEQWVRCGAECRKSYRRHSEKQSDANLVAHMVSDALINDDVDRIMLVSADSDFNAAIKVIRNLKPSVGFKILAPPGKGRMAGKWARGIPVKEFSPLHLSNALLPAEVSEPGTELTLTRPAAYDPPA